MQVPATTYDATVVWPAWNESKLDVTKPAAHHYAKLSMVGGKLRVFHGAAGLTMDIGYRGIGTYCERTVPARKEQLRIDLSGFILSVDPQGFADWVRRYK